MATVHVPSAPYPPSQAVFVNSRINTDKHFDKQHPIDVSEIHKLTAMPLSVAFFDYRTLDGPHRGAMCVSACGTQAQQQIIGAENKGPFIDALGVICDPILDGNGVLRHPHQLGSVACGIRGMFSIAVNDADIRDAAIGDYLYISDDQTNQADVANSVKGYKLLKYKVEQEGIQQYKIIGRIVGFGPSNEVSVILT